MDKFIFACIFLFAGAVIKNENEKLKYERYKKEQETKNKFLKKVRHVLNQIMNDIENQTGAAYHFVKKKEPIIYLSPGDHIAIDRYFPVPYSHHGIFVGNGQVIHYVPPGIVKLTDLSTFKDYSDGLIYKIESITSLTPEQICKLAYSKIGEKNYDYVMNNCETFSRWCRYGN